MQLLAKGCTKDAVIHYAGKVAASEDSNIKTNSETVIEICLKANRNVDSQLKEDDAMDIGETIKGIFEVAAKQGRKEGRQEGLNEDRERVATDMLKDGEPLDKILRYSRLAEDSIRSLAKSLGVAVV